MNNIIEGLIILRGYDSKAGDFCAEHDQIWAGPELDFEDFNKEDVLKLEALGWFYDDDVESWSHFC